ncbi:MAG: hypothetical protein ACXWB4_06270 [Kaistella sp.]
MKIQLKAGTFILFVALLFFGCNSDSRENPRAYVEGKLVSATVDYNKFSFRIVSDNVIVAETMLEADGNFKLSGPIGNAGFLLISTEKMKSFNTDKAGLSLSADGLQINVPAGITYLKFTEIVLEK